MKLSKLTVILLCFSLLFAACERQNAKNSSAQETEAHNIAVEVTGRYLEHEIDFPELNRLIALEQTAPNTYYALGVQEDGMAVWRSEDGGETWRTVEYPGLSAYNSETVACGGAFSPDGSFYLNYGESDPDNPGNYLFHTAITDETGVTPINGLPELDNYIFGMTRTSSGDLVLSGGFSFNRLDPETGETEEYRLLEGQAFACNYTVYGDKLAAVDGSQITVFDAAAGETAAVKLPTKMGMDTALAVQDNESGFFYVNHDGLYRVTMDGVIHEQIIDGALAGFGMPSVSFLKLFACQDGSFLTATQEGETIRMSRYVFDPEAAREPDQQLTVFSLRDDKYIRQVIGQYQRQNPDVMVKLEIGLPEDTALTASDAIRTLSTELLAGGGPDLFVLDGLPVDSYIEKGALLDLAPALEPMMSELLPNVVEAYRTGEHIYTFPARVAMPVIAGIGTSDIENLHDLVIWLETQPQQWIGVPPDMLMEHFYPVLAAKWFEADSTLDTAALTADLTDLKHLAEIEGDSERVAIDLLNQTVLWSGDGVPLVVGDMDSLERVADLYSAFDMRGGGVISKFPLDTGGCLIPRSMLGANISGSQTELSLNFVRFALGADMQASFFGNGIPTSRAALEAMIDSKNTGDPVTSLYVSYINDSSVEEYDEYELNSVWPEADSMRVIIKVIESVTEISPQNEIVRQMVLEETAGLLTGEKTVDEVVADLGEKVERYLQE